jgi:hypothetical protein
MSKRDAVVAAAARVAALRINRIFSPFESIVGDVSAS